MFGSSTLEVAIGLIFVYLLLSLICTAANEMLAAVMKMRAKNLEKGIRNLLNDQPGNDLAEKFYDHPLIKGLYREKKRPSYIPSRTFALALMDILMPVEGARPKNIEDISNSIAANKDLNEDVKKTLLVLIDEAGNTPDKRVSDFNKVLSNIESWFNNSMERVAGWYKRRTEIVIFLLAILFTFSLNVDTISIFKSLSNDSTLRASIVAAAQEAAKQPSLLNTSKQTISEDTVTTGSDDTGNRSSSEDIDEIFGGLKKHIGEIEQLGIPVGWNTPFYDKGLSIWQKIWWWITKFFGLILTVFAASLGAPFWFDILNKIISIRSTGKAQKEAPGPEKASPSTSSP